MKRYDITNKVNGMKFMVERETLEPMQPEWGQPEREVIVTPAIPAHEVLNEETGEITMTEEVPAVIETLPAEHEITVTDISGELEAQAESDEARAYLLATDYVVAKIAEAGILGQDIAPLVEKYQEVLERREAARLRVL